MLHTLTDHFYGACRRNSFALQAVLGMLCGAGNWRAACGGLSSCLAPALASDGPLQRRSHPAMVQGKAGGQRDIRAFFVVPAQRSAQPQKPGNAPADRQQAGPHQPAACSGGPQAGPAPDSRLPGGSGAACEQQQGGRGGASSRPSPAAAGAAGGERGTAAGHGDSAFHVPGAAGGLECPAAAAPGARQGSGSNDGSGGSLTEYELERLARIRRNQEVRLCVVSWNAGLLTVSVKTIRMMRQKDAAHGWHAWVAG